MIENINEFPNHRLGPGSEDQEPFPAPKVEVKIGHAHQCTRIATAPSMGEGRDFWIGKLKEPIGVETHCLHLKTMAKDITFLCNEADFRNIIVMCSAVVGITNNEWLSTMIKLTKTQDDGSKR